MYRILWVKCKTSVEFKSIRIAESSVMDSWNGLCLAQCRFSKDFFLENEESAGRSNWRVMPWHKKGLEYLKGTSKELEMVDTSQTYL
jgi:hypothetical protein